MRRRGWGDDGTLLEPLCRLFSSLRHLRDFSFICYVTVTIIAFYFDVFLNFLWFVRNNFFLGRSFFGGNLLYYLLFLGLLWNAYRRTKLALGGRRSFNGWRYLRALSFYDCSDRFNHCLRCLSICHHRVLDTSHICLLGFWAFSDYCTKHCDMHLISQVRLYLGPKDIHNLKAILHQDLTALDRCLGLSLVVQFDFS